MKNLLLILLLVAIQTNVFAGDDPNYSITSIPLKLLKNAEMIVRFEEETFTLKNPGEAVYYRKYAFTILNENADHYAEFVQTYDDFFDLKYVEGRLYDAMGKKIRELKRKDLQDQSAVSDISLMEDNRLKRHSFYYRSYPYTVEYEYEIKFNGTMFYPSWFPQSSQRVAVQESKFSFICPTAYPFRFKQQHFDGTPVVTESKGMKTSTWEMKNTAALLSEPYAPSFRSLIPAVLFGPEAFEMQGYKGNMQSWQDLGKFIYSLRNGRDVLPDDVKTRVHQLTDNINDPALKVKLLYEYMQQNTRYISIQLGIGGWQPFDAKYVASKKYGDCKALSNYMAALLKEAGIPSNYALVNGGSGKERIAADFPSAQFNHAILCVPLKNDSIWLECTSQTVSPGYMGDFTGNRYSLLVDENGGKLVKTPAYTYKDNVRSRLVTAEVQANGDVKVQSSTNFKALQQDDVQQMIHYLSKTKVKEYLHDQLDFATYDINTFDYKEVKGKKPEMQETLDLHVSSYATITGKRLFIVPNLMSKSVSRPVMDTTRKYPLELSEGFTHLDTVQIKIPQGYTIESMPADVAITTDFGSYQSSVKLKDDQITYYRQYKIVEGSWSVEAYNKFVEFLGNVYKADRKSVVLVK